MSTIARTSLALAAVLLASCAGGVGHPVRLSLPRLDPGEAPPTPVAADEPVAPQDADVAAFLFRGLEGVLRPLERLHAKPVQHGRAPVFTALPRMESAVLARHRGGGYGGPVRIVVAVAASGRLPLAPAAVAQLLMDADVECAVLSAATFRVVGREYELPGALRRRYWVELLRVGRGPMRYDLRFGLAVERRDAPNGRVLLRYDPRPGAASEHVTLYRGGCLLEPVEGGTHLTEILILGTDIRVPFFLEDAVRDVTRDKLRKRVTGLWARAWAGR